jgi:hypothetical protein
MEERHNAVQMEGKKSARDTITGSEKEEKSFSYSQLPRPA